MGFTILNWNVGGAKYLDLEEDDRKNFKDDLNFELFKLIDKHKPHVVTLQEIVRFGETKDNAVDIIEKKTGI